MGVSRPTRRSTILAMVYQALGLPVVGPWHGRVQVRSVLMGLQAHAILASPVERTRHAGRRQRCHGGRSLWLWPGVSWIRRAIRRQRHAAVAATGGLQDCAGRPAGQ